MTRPEAPPLTLPLADPMPRNLDDFLAGVERRAFRLAELALGQREDALDAVQEAMIKLLRYRQRPAADWSPLFWSILRRQITDRHRRNTVKRRVMVALGRGDVTRDDLLERQADPRQARRGSCSTPMRGRLSAGPCGRCLAGSGSASCSASCRGWTSRRQPG